MAKCVRFGNRGEEMFHSRDEFELPESCGDRKLRSWEREREEARASDKSKNFR